MSRALKLLNLAKKLSYTEDNKNIHHVTNKNFKNKDKTTRVRQNEYETPLSDQDYEHYEPMNDVFNSDDLPLFLHSDNAQYCDLQPVKSPEADVHNNRNLFNLNTDNVQYCDLQPVENVKADDDVPLNDGQICNFELESLCTRSNQNIVNNLDQNYEFPFKINTDDKSVSISSVDDSDGDSDYVPFNDGHTSVIEYENLSICSNQNIENNLVQNNISDGLSLLLESYENISSDSDNDNEVCSTQKKRFKNGKRTYMDKRKKLGLDYENRKGKKMSKKLFSCLNGMCCKQKCNVVCSEETQKQIFKDFYLLGNSVAQDQVIMDGIQIMDKKRATTIFRREEPEKTHNRQITVKYYLNLNGNQQEICKKMFQNTYGISRGKVDVMIFKKRSSATGISSTTGKGTHKPHNFNIDIRTRMLNHIKSFPLQESHYARKRTSRLYLSSSLNISKMYDLYKDYCHQNGFKDESSYWLYRTVFSETGLKFKLPYVDTCKTCDEFKIKSRHVFDEELQILNQKNQDHINMVELAYNSKKEDKVLLTTTPSLKVIVFDLQQCLPTPDLKTNIVFYKRQLWTYNETIRDLSKNESYCYMWHEAIARRGSIEVASILYKFIQGKIDNNITHLITYSDTCSGQNRNINVALMFMFALQNHPSLQIVDQKFLVPGHTHLECDSDHSRIERCKKQSESTISIPNDWYNFVRNVRGKIPLKVIEMEQIDFKSFSSLLSGPLVKRALDTDKEKINWLKMTWIRYDKTFGIIQFKYTLNKEAPFRILDLRKGAIRTRNRAELTSGVSNIRLPQTYNGPLSIDSEKKKDLISLLPLLDPIYHQFYKDLKTNTRAAMIQQSDEESSSED